MFDVVLVHDLKDALDFSMQIFMNRYDFVCFIYIYIYIYTNPYTYKYIYIYVHIYM